MIPKLYWHCIYFLPILCSADELQWACNWVLRSRDLRGVWSVGHREYENLLLDQTVNSSFHTKRRNSSLFDHSLSWSSSLSFSCPFAAFRELRSLQFERAPEWGGEGILGWDFATDGGWLSSSDPVGVTKV